MNPYGWFAIAGLLALQGCAAGSIAGAAMELTGIRKAPELPDAQKPPRSVALRLHADQNLNAGAGRQPLALAVRLYKLRQPATFERMSFDSFLDPQTERALLGNDLLEVRELMLIPGQRYDASEKVTREAYFVGVVALFQAPAPRRWRLAVAAADAEKSGLTVGLHACTLSTGADAAPLADAPCR